MADPTLPSLNFLFDCSDTTLGDLEMAALNRGAKHLKAAKAEWNEAVSQFANAEVARYFREQRTEILDDEFLRAAFLAASICAFRAGFFAGFMPPLPGTSISIRSWRASIPCRASPAPG